MIVVDDVLGGGKFRSLRHGEVDDQIGHRFLACNNIGADAQDPSIGQKKPQQLILLFGAPGSYGPKNTGPVGCCEEGGKRLF